MKRVFLLFAVAVVCSLVSCSSAGTKSELKTDIDSVSYYFGMSRSEGIMDYLTMQAGIDTAYIDEFYKGFRAGIKKSDPGDVAYLEGMRIAQMINNQWIKNINNEIYMEDSSRSVNGKLVLAGFYHGIRSRDNMRIMQAQTYAQVKIAEVKENFKKEKYAESIAANEKYLADNKSREGVKTTESGLQYRIITEGVGELPEKTSKVKVNYRGTLIDGTEFDSSYKKNEPAGFRVNQLIRGWSEALTMMPVGSKWELCIPQELGYGTMGQGNDIPPYSTLIFEVELLEIEK